MCIGCGALFCSTAKAASAGNGAPEVEALLSHLAVDRQVPGIDLPWLDDVVQGRRPRRLPVVLTLAEVRELLLHVEGAAS